MIATIIVTNIVLIVLLALLLIVGILLLKKTNFIFHSTSLNPKENPNNSQAPRTLTEGYGEKGIKKEIGGHIKTLKDSVVAIEQIANRITEKELREAPKPSTKEWKYDLFVDAGHGTLKDGVHTTIAGMGRYWTHKKGTFHKGTTFYEGMSNRILAEKYIKRAEELGMRIVRTYSYLDDGLTYRVGRVNYHHQEVKKGLLLSFHSNASPKQNARGIEIYTTRGETDSDKFAQRIWDELKKYFPDYMRSQKYVDGDDDYEANFKIIYKTLGVATLLELFFFDNYEDALLLMSEDIQDKLVDALIKATIWAQGNL